MAFFANIPMMILFYSAMFEKYNIDCFFDYFHTDIPLTAHFELRDYIPKDTL